MTQFTLTDIEGHKFNWYSEESPPIEEIEQEASMWFGRYLSLFDEVESSTVQ
jgi:hypothetical protein